MSSVQTGQPGASPGGRGLGLSLLVIATAQLMLVLDDTIANIALPSIQRELAVSAATLPWIINAYILAFGGLLLFGGRVGDLFGRRRVFRVGLGLFTLASLLGGLGLNAEMLIAARGLQGIGAALTAPNALALIATTFPVGKPRNSAMAVYGGHVGARHHHRRAARRGPDRDCWAGDGSSSSTSPSAWRCSPAPGCWPKGSATPAGSTRPARSRGTGAMVALTYGITHAGEHGWGDAVTAGRLRRGPGPGRALPLAPGARGAPDAAAGALPRPQPVGLLRDHAVHRRRADGHLLPADALPAAGPAVQPRYGPAWPRCPSASASSSGRASAPSWSSASRRVPWPVRACWWRRWACTGSRR